MVPTKHLRQLHQCHVDLGGHGTKDHVTVSLDAVRAQVTPLGPRLDAAAGTECPHPADRGRNADPEPFSRRTPRQPRLNRRNPASEDRPTASVPCMLASSQQTW